jgi:hypothetical protein
VSKQPTQNHAKLSSKWNVIELVAEAGLQHALLDDDGNADGLYHGKEFIHAETAKKHHHTSKQPFKNVEIDLRTAIPILLRTKSKPNNPSPRPVQTKTSTTPLSYREYSSTDNITPKYASISDSV